MILCVLHVFSQFFFFFALSFSSDEKQHKCLERRKIAHNFGSWKLSFFLRIYIPYAWYARPTIIIGQIQIVCLPNEWSIEKTVCVYNIIFFFDFFLRFLRHRQTTIRKCFVKLVFCSGQIVHFSTLLLFKLFEMDLLDQPA